MSDAVLPATGPSRSRPGPRSLLRALRLLLATGAVAFPATAPAAVPTEIKGEPMTLSYAYHHFDGVEVDTVVLTARSLELMTDTLGAWAPDGEGGTSDGFVLKHRKRAGVHLILRPFAGRGPAGNDDDWRSYRWEVATHLGAETQIQDVGKSGTAGGVTSLGSWETREAYFETPQPEGGSRAERHIVAGDGRRGIVIIASGPTADLAAADPDLRFFLARLERREPVRTATNG